MPLVSLLQPETGEDLRKQFGGVVNPLAPTELQALTIAKEEGLVSNPRLQDCLTDHPTNIGRID